MRNAKSIYRNLARKVLTLTLVLLGGAASNSSLAQGVKSDTLNAEQVKWNEAYHFVINFSIKKPSGRFERPYSAVWIEDVNGDPVRTISLWANTDPKHIKYLAELRRWSKMDKLRKTKDDTGKDATDLAASVSGPTRLPGNYSVVWDGKNDQKKPVAQGTYILFIEVAREDGPYQRIRQEITFGESAFKKEVADSGEIEKVSLEFAVKK